jgi:hypothetical protein
VFSPSHSNEILGVLESIVKEVAVLDIGDPFEFAEMYGFYAYEPMQPFPIVLDTDPLPDDL